MRYACVGRDMTMQDLVVTAVREWLERVEDEDDRRVIRERENEDSVTWEDAKRLMQEGRLAKGDGA